MGGVLSIFTKGVATLSASAFIHERAPMFVVSTWTA